jgi:hypothetical protein
MRPTGAGRGWFRPGGAANQQVFAQQERSRSPVAIVFEPVDSVDGGAEADVFVRLYVSVLFLNLPEY